MNPYTLNRQEQGKLAEQLVRGLHSAPHDDLKETIISHAQDFYADLIDNWSPACKLTNISGYRWKDLLRVPIPEDVSWRPDIIMQATWRCQYTSETIPDSNYWKRDLPPFSLWVPAVASFSHGRRTPQLSCLFRAYYPIEVKSGAKKTLTDSQATAIPRVAKEVPYVHPVIVEVDLTDLPSEYQINVEMFSSSDWDANSSRYKKA